MSRPRITKKESTRSWLAGMAVTLTTIVSYLAFWRLAPGTTFIVGCVSLLGLVVAGWMLGREKKATQHSERAPQQRIDPDV
jgi:hypothetical protein